MSYIKYWVPITGSGQILATLTLTLTFNFNFKIYFHTSWIRNLHMT